MSNVKKRYETTVLTRNQPEIIKRFNETLTLNPADRNVERMEYTRIMSFHTATKLKVNGDIKFIGDWAKETNIEIDFTAKQFLRRWENIILTGTLHDSERFTQMYVAFKWILAHDDSDIFPGSIGGSFAGMMQSNSFYYIKQQMITGEWDKKTAEAIKRLRNE